MPKLINNNQYALNQVTDSQDQSYYSEMARIMRMSNDPQERSIAAKIMGQKGGSNSSAASGKKDMNASKKTSQKSGSNKDSGKNGSSSGSGSSKSSTKGGSSGGKSSAKK